MICRTNLRHLPLELFSLALCCVLSADVLALFDVVPAAGEGCGGRRVRPARRQPRRGDHQRGMHVPATGTGLLRQWWAITGSNSRVRCHRRRKRHTCYCRDTQHRTHVWTRSSTSVIALILVDRSPYFRKGQVKAIHARMCTHRRTVETFVHDTCFFYRGNQSLSKNFVVNDSILGQRHSVW